jgi:hypothetical protein
MISVSKTQNAIIHDHYQEEKENLENAIENPISKKTHSTPLLLQIINITLYASQVIFHP